MTPDKKVDVTVDNQGTIFVFYLSTKKARSWVKNNVDIPGYWHLGKNSFACEHKFAYDIAQGMLNDGLNVI